MAVTIEERAKQYAEEIYGGSFAVEIAFRRGAQSERAELTRWRDPKEETPNENEWVVLLMPDNYWVRYAIALFHDGQYHVMGLQVQIIRNDEFLGWRQIED